MTDPADTAPSDDEVVSAHLDGAATPEEAARVESEPALSSRLDQFAAVSSRVRDVPPPSTDAVDDHVAAAMAAFEPTGAGSTDGDGEVVDRRDPGFWRRLPLGAVAAAAAVLVVVVGVIGLAGSTGEDVTDTASQDLEQSTGGTAGSAGDDAAADRGVALEATEEAPPVNRARFTDTDELAVHLRAQLSAQPTAAAESSDGEVDGAEPGRSDDAGTRAAGAGDTAEDVDPCDVVALLGLDPSSVVTVVPALIEERPVTAVVHGSGDERRLVVVDDQTCTTTDDRAL